MKSYKYGVYKISSLSDKKRYYGGGILKARKLYHFNLLRTNKHNNSNLQKAYNLNKEENFKFIVLLYCEPFELTRYEQFFVDKYKKSKLLYNICIDNVENKSGVKTSQKTKEKISKALKNRIFSPETRKKISESVKGKNSSMYGRFGKNHPRYGKPHSLETIKKLSGINHYNITKQDVILNIVEMLKEGYSVKDITSTLNVGRKVVYGVKNGFYDNIYDLKNTDY